MRKMIKYPYCGAFGEREMTVTSKIMKRYVLGLSFKNLVFLLIGVFSELSILEAAHSHLSRLLALVSTIFRISLLLIDRNFS